MNKQLAGQFIVMGFLLGGTTRALADEEPAMADSSASTTSDRAEKSGWKQSDWFGPWQFEVVATGVGGFSGRGGIYGGGLGLGLRHVREFNARPIVGVHEDFGVLLAVLTMGISAAPQGMWMGNEWGFEARARWLQIDKRDMPPEQRLMFGISPSFRITRAGSRLRFPAVLPTFVPELGVSLSSRYRPEMLLEFHPFTMGFLLTPHVTLELESTAMFLIPSDNRQVEVWALQSLSFALR